MLNAKRLMSVVLILAMLVTMASFPVSAAEAEWKVIPATLTFSSVSGGYYYNSPNYHPEKALDGNRATGFSTAQDNGSTNKERSDVCVIYELADVSLLDTLVLKWGASWGNQAPDAYKVFVSEDGTDYTEILSYENLYDKTAAAATYSGYSYVSGTGSGYTMKYDVTETGLNIDNVKYIKIQPTKYYYRAALAEIEVSVLREVILTSYTVNYVDTEGNPIADAKVVDTNTFVGDNATETAPTIPGYEVNDESTKTITLVEGENVITFTYEKLPDFNYTVKYVDEEGNPIVPETTGVAIYPYEVTIETPYVNGYYRPAAVTKTIATDGEVVEIVYEALPEKMMPTPDNLLGNATVSSPRYDDNSVSNLDHLLDDDDKTCLNARWNENITITVDLHGQYDISDISLLWCGGSKSANYDKLPTGKQMPGGLRATKYTISVSTDDTTYVPVYTYEDSDRTESKDVITTADFTATPKGVRYVKISTAGTFTSGRITLFDIDVNGYVVTDRVSSVPPYKYYAKGSESVTFPITVMTLENVEPSFFANKANWTLENATIDGDIVINNVSDPASDYYTWEFDVKVVPTDNEKEFSLEIDLPDSYVLQDKLTLSREAVDFLFDASIADGDNKIEVSKTDITIEYESDKTTIKTKEKDRTVDVAVTVQHIIENNPAYKGFADFAIEVTDIIANGDRVTVDFKNDFIRVGDTYYGRFTFDRLGMERFQATVVLYGVYSNGTKEELEKRVIYSDPINIVTPLGGISTEAQKIKEYSLPIDILDQLFDQVHPYDLPVLTDSEWELYRDVLKERGLTLYSAQLEIDRLRNKIAELQEAAADPAWVAPNYPDIVKIVNGRYRWVDSSETDPDGKKIKVRAGTDVNDKTNYEQLLRVGSDAWNILKDLHVEGFSFKTKIENAPENVRPYETVPDDIWLTFRNGIDYDPKVNMLGSCFNIRIFFIASSADYNKEDDTFLGKGYNAVRRALNDDQVMPLMFRLGWYNWPSKSNPNPFKGGVFTVTIPDAWLDNNGSFNLAAYHMAGYSYSKDNDPTLTLIADDLDARITNKLDDPDKIQGEVSFEVKGDQKLYDTFVIVGTDKLPSELPDTLSIYYEFE